MNRIPVRLSSGRLCCSAQILVPGCGGIVVDPDRRTPGDAVLPSSGVAHEHVGVDHSQHDTRSRHPLKAARDGQQSLLCRWGNRAAQDAAHHGPSFPRHKPTRGALRSSASGTGGHPGSMAWPTAWPAAWLMAGGAVGPPTAFPGHPTPRRSRSQLQFQLPSRLQAGGARRHAPAHAPARDPAWR